MALAVKASIVALLVGLTLSQQRTFASDEALWRNAVRWAPAAVRPALNLGATYRRLGQMDAAEHWLRYAEARLPEERWRDDYRCAIARQAVLMTITGSPICRNEQPPSLCVC